MESSEAINSMASGKKVPGIKEENNNQQMLMILLEESDSL